MSLESGGERFRNPTALLRPVGTGSFEAVRPRRSPNPVGSISCPKAGGRSEPPAGVPTGDSTQARPSRRPRSRFWLARFRDVRFVFANTGLRPAGPGSRVSSPESFESSLPIPEPSCRIRSPSRVDGAGRNRYGRAARDSRLEAGLGGAPGPENEKPRERSGRNRLPLGALCAVLRRPGEPITVSRRSLLDLAVLVRGTCPLRAGCPRSGFPRLGQMEHTDPAAAGQADSLVRFRDSRFVFADRCESHFCHSRFV